MDVGMAALARALLTSVALGIVLCVLFCLTRFIVKLMLPLRGKKWTRELWLFYKVVFSAIAVLLFLYATNRGIFRWFLMAGIVASCLLTDRLIGRRISAFGDRLTAQVRSAILRFLIWVTTPFRRIGGYVGRKACRIYRKMRLLAASIYDKLLTKRYDRKRRSRMDRAVRGEIDRLLGGIN